MTFVLRSFAGLSSFSASRPLPPRHGFGGWFLSPRLPLAGLKDGEGGSPHGTSSESGGFCGPVGGFGNVIGVEGESVCRTPAPERLSLFRTVESQAHTGMSLPLQELYALKGSQGSWQHSSLPPAPGPPRHSGAPGRGAEARLGSCQGLHTAGGKGIFTRTSKIWRR